MVNYNPEFCLPESSILANAHAPDASSVRLRSEKSALYQMQIVVSNWRELTAKLDKSSLKRHASMSLMVSRLTAPKSEVAQMVSTKHLKYLQGYVFLPFFHWKA